jgi:hypothetical protein
MKAEQAAAQRVAAEKAQAEAAKVSQQKALEQARLQQEKLAAQRVKAEEAAKAKQIADDLAQQKAAQAQIAADIAAQEKAAAKALLAQKAQAEANRKVAERMAKRNEKKPAALSFFKGVDSRDPIHNHAVFNSISLDANDGLELVNIDANHATRVSDIAPYSPRGRSSG